MGLGSPEFVMAFVCTTLSGSRPMMNVSVRFGNAFHWELPPTPIQVDDVVVRWSIPLTALVSADRTVDDKTEKRLLCRELGGFI